MRYFPALVFVLALLALPAFAAGNAIKMGISIPRTGEVAAYGDDLQAGINLAVADINAKGGVLGKKLDPIIEDDAADPKTSVAVANHFVGNNIDVAINGVSRTSLAIAPIYAEENIPFLNFASTDEITAHGWHNIVRIGPKNGQEAPKLAALIEKEAAGHKLAVLYESEEYSSNLTEDVLRLLAKSGKVKPQLVQKMSGRDDDFSALISRMKNGGIDVVYLGLWPKGTGLVLRQAAAADYHPHFIGDFTASMDELVKIAGPQSNGLVFTMTPDPQYVPSAKRVVEALAAQHVVHHPFAVYGYLMVQIYAEAVQKAGSTAGDKVMAALKSETFDTIMGPVSFADNGDMKGLDFEYYQWQSGNIVPYQ
jgi:branched-chain amino acid transport system substrate-binding protein